MADSKYYEFVCFHVSPQYYASFASQFKTKLDFFQKHGAKVFGRYSCRIGGIGEYLVILEHDSLSQKLNQMKAIMADQEYVKFNEGFMKMVGSVCTQVTKCVPGQPILAPNPNNFLFVRKFNVKGNPFETAMAYKKSNEEIFKKYVEPYGFKVVGYFVPMYGDCCGSVTIVYDMGSSPDCLEAPVEIFKIISTDQSAKAAAKETFDTVHGFSTKIYCTAQ